ncbi:MAG: hypothetical protein DHS20C19_04540 [Acidimicrobiales bacterium]|nr:MAG: hypothetical protein DHS20C19_04540 [Acidimicrobiales bacterium]
MRRLLEAVGRKLGRLIELSLFGNKKSGTPDSADDEGNFENASPLGCLLSAVAALIVGVLLFLITMALIDALKDDGTSSTDGAGPADGAGTGDDGSDGVEADTSGAGSFVDAANPVLVPSAGTWSINNGMFVPNCGPDDPEPDAAVDAGTIDVWESGAALELEGPDGGAIAFERTAVSESEATYRGGVSFIEMELRFDSSTSFDATITYDGEEECVRRAAQGTLIEGDDARQHGADPAPSSGAFGEVGIDEAGDGAVAVVTIGDDSYEFFAEGIGTCDPDFFGGFHAVLYSPGFTNSVTIDLVTDDNRVSTVMMNLQDAGLDLVADAEGAWAAVEEGSSAVLDFSIDGMTASGSVSFINEDRAFSADNYPLDPIEATFTASCG